MWVCRGKCLQVEVCRGGSVGLEAMYTVCMVYHPSRQDLGQPPAACSGVGEEPGVS
jgi:hypothetical protein